MKHPARLVLAFVTPILLIWSAVADAQSCSAGKTVYSTYCAQCHTAPNPDGRTVTGQWPNWTTIKDALNGNIPGDTTMASNGLGAILSDTQLQNVSYYLWLNVGGNCPSGGGTPTLSVSPTSLSFGNVNVGSSSPTQSFTVSNTGTGAESSLAIGAAPAQFSRTTTCGASLAANAICTVTVTFSPTAIGAAGGSIAVTASVAVTGAPVSVSGTGVQATAPNVSASPTSLAFGNVNVGTTSPAQTITVSNTGNASATNMSYPAAPPKFTKGGTCGSATLAAGATCTITFTYSPLTATADNATYKITGGGATIPISLSGTGVATPAALSASPTSLAFGSVTVGSTSAAKVVTITNTGGQAATGVAVASGSARFPATNNCSASLAAGASCTVSVTYAPNAAASDSGNLTVSYTGGTNVVVGMTGTGTAAAAPNLAASPTSLAFGSVTIGSSAPAQTVTVTNTGGAQATGVSVASANAKFPLSANTCGAALNAGASCTFGVGYAPSATGADSAHVTVSYTGGATVSVAVSGTGTAAAAPNLTAAPPVVAFGNVVVGQTSAGTTVTVTNSGNGGATGMSFAVANSARFPVSGNTCGATLGAGASCTFTVAYAPAAVGSDSGSATITYAGGGALVVSFSGSGVSAPPSGTGQLSFASALTFASTSIGASSTAQTVNVTNVGSAPVNVTGVTSNSGEFTVGANTCGNVGAGGTCTFAVTFTPSAAGARSGVITVTSSGAGSPQTIAASGTGVSGTVPPTPLPVAAIEYYHANFDHYFITAIADEITKLDNGTFVGWARTGRSFKVFPSRVSGINAVCRFFSTAFDPKSSHFYTPNADECTVVKANKDWQFEGEVFWVNYPALDGSCPTDLVPVYRVYNNGQGAAPNHRYTTDLQVRKDMIAKGWIPEGAGDIGVIMCVPQ
ncbi:MAG: choice-of-anchor D domain-containing protein [Burkholderiales bacterium]